jgi:hypothetical protein
LVEYNALKIEIKRIIITLIETGAKINNGIKTTRMYGSNL